MDRDESELQQLRRELAALQARVELLEQLRSVEHRSAPTPAHSPEVAHHPQPQVRREAKPLKRSLLGEDFLSRTLPGWLGLFSLFLASVWFLVYAIEQGWINLTLRIAAALAIGFGLHLFAWRLFRRGGGWQATGLIGIGTTLIYGSIFATSFFPATFGFSYLEVLIALVAIALYSLTLSVRIDSQTLFQFSLAGLVVAPFLPLATESPVPFLQIYLIAVVALALVVLRGRNWFWAATTLQPILLPLYAAIGFYLLGTTLEEDPLHYPAAMVAALFTLAAMLHYRVVDFRSERNWLYETLYFVPLLGLPLMLLLAASYPPPLEAFRPHLFLLAGAVVAAIYWRGDRLSGRLHPQQRLHLIAAILLTLFVAITLFAEGGALRLLYLGFTAILVWSGLELRQRLLLALSFAASLLVVVMLHFESSAAPQLPLLNADFALRLLALALLLLAVWRCKEVASATIDLRPFRLIFAGLALYLYLFTGMREIGAVSATAAGESVSISIFLLLSALSLAFAAWRFSNRPLYLTAMLFLALAALKFYLHDIWNLPLLMRVVAAILTGGGLVMVSLFYKKIKSKFSVSALPVLLLFSVAMVLPLPDGGSSGSGALHAESTAAVAAPLTRHRFVRALEYSGESRAAADWQRGEERLIGQLTLEPAILEESTLRDLRLRYGAESRAVPMLLRQARESESHQQSHPIEILHRNLALGGRHSITLRLPELPEERYYSRIDFSTTGSFETTLVVESSRDGARWQRLYSQPLNHYEGESFSLTLDRSDNLYRITFGERFAVEPTLAVSQLRRTPLYESATLTDQVRVGKAKDGSGLAFELPELSRRPAYIDLTLSAHDFKRRLTLIRDYGVTIAGRDLRTVAWQSIEGFRDEENRIRIHLDHDTTLPQSGERFHYRIEIDDPHNLPLELQVLEVSWPVWEILFDISAIIDRVDLFDPQQLQLFYGNRYVDLVDHQLFVEKQATLRYFSTATASENRDYRFSLFEPPASTWTIRLLFWLGMLFLLWQLYRIVRSGGAAAAGDER